MSWGITLAAMLALSVVVAFYIAWPLLVDRPEKRADDEEDEAGSALDQLLVEKDATYSAIKELEFDHAMGNLSKQDYKELARRYEDKAIALLKTIDEVSDNRPRLSIETPAVAGIMVGPARGRQQSDDPIEEQVAALRRAKKGRRRGGALAPEDEIEEEVARLRGTRQPKPGRSDAMLQDEVERQVAGLRSGRAAQVAAPVAAPVGAHGVRPPQLGGAQAQTEPRICPACGRPAKGASAAFCSRCGAALAIACPVCGVPAEAGDAFCSACGTSIGAGDAREEGQTIVGGANV